MNLKDVKNLDTDTLLGALGVERKRGGDWVAPAILGLFLGAVAGMASALLLAPQSGEALRRRLRGGLDDAKELNPAPSAVPASAARLSRSGGAPV